MRNFLIVIWLIVPSIAFAQTPPSPTQIENYSGLHKAAHENDFFDYILVAWKTSVSMIDRLNVHCAEPVSKNNMGKVSAVFSI